MNVLIGAPVYDRAWILPEWFSAIEKQDMPLSNIGFVFEGAPNDEATINLLLDWHARHPEVLCFDVSINTKQGHASHKEGRRQWTHDRYYDMVAFRNNLLDRAIGYDFDRYFSLDTDIILEDPATISRLAAFAERPVAVAPLMFMSPSSIRHPSVMSWLGQPGGRAKRLNYPLGTTFKADVIMAAKMMSHSVYHNVRYAWHAQGEDLGWSANCAKQNYELYSMSDLYCPHIMNRSMLNRYKMEGDNRKVEKRTTIDT